MGNSRAEQATSGQGNGNYIGHDVYQNGYIDRSNDRVYVAGWSNDWGNSGYASGFFTDQSTIDGCSHAGVLNTNELDESLQTKLSDIGTNHNEFQAHSNVSAYDIDYNKLDALKTGTADEQNLHSRLTNPDGMSPDSDTIKVAYGKANANTQHGSGDGNQYYMPPKDFQDGINAGVFRYNSDESYSVDGSTGKSISRKDISRSDYGDYDGGKYQDRLSVATDNERDRNKERFTERKISGQTEAEQINSQTVKNDPSKPYITKPDPAYHYGMGTEDKYGNSTTNTTGHPQDYASHTNNIHAPPASGAEKSSPIPPAKGVNGEKYSDDSSPIPPAKGMNGENYDDSGDIKGMLNSTSHNNGPLDSAPSPDKGMGM